MSEPFLGEIKLMSFSFPPRGWAQCNGQLLPINQNQALFSLLGTTYGGDGRVNFALPDLRDRVPAHRGAEIPQGARVGANSVSLSISQLPAHTHAVSATSANATTNNAGAGAGATLAYARASTPLYGPASGLVATNAASIGNVGGSQPHENRQPFLTVNFCIALQGIFPSQN